MLDEHGGLALVEVPGAVTKVSGRNGQLPLPAPPSGGRGNLTAVSGALLGLTLGIGVGAAFARAVTVQQAGVPTITLPATQLLVDLILAGTAGLLAAAVPAHRAAQLDQLTAIGIE